MNLNEAKELLENEGYLVEKIDPNGSPIYRTREGIVTNRPNTHNKPNRQRTNKPRTNLIPAEEAQLTAYTKVMAIVDDLVNWISENGEDSGVSEYILNQLLKAQKIEKQAQSVK